MLESLTLRKISDNKLNLVIVGDSFLTFFLLKMKHGKNQGKTG